MPDKRRGLVRIALAGVCFGLAGLATARVFVLAVPIIILFYETTSPRSLRHTAIATVVFLMAASSTVAPYTARNYLCFDKFIPISMNAGINFYTSFNDKATSSYIHQRDFPAPHDKTLRTDNPTFFKAGLAWIVENPWKAVVLVGKKVHQSWRVHYADSALFYPFFWIGIFLLRRYATPEKKAVTRFVQLSILVYTVFHCLFITRFYYLIPLLPLVYSVALSYQRQIGCNLIKRV